MPNGCPSSRSLARGFTLIEVLVALVVVAVAMTAAILVVSERTRDGTYLRDKTLAHWIAMNIVTERRLQAQAPSLGKTSDEVEYAGRKWRWTLLVDKTAVETMRRLDVSVRGADDPEDSSLATVTGFFGTAVVPPGNSAVQWDVGSRAGGPPNGQNDGNGEQVDTGDEDDDGQATDDGGDADDGTDDSGGDTDDGGDDNSTDEPVIEGQPPQEGGD
jgi:general secretion pathway protein I